MHNWAMAVISIACNVNGQPTPVDFHVGEPDDKNHPIHHQSSWLSENRGINVPPEMMESLKELHAIAKRNKVDFEELCVLTFQHALDNKDEEDEGDTPAIGQGQQQGAAQSVDTGPEIL